MKHREKIKGDPLLRKIVDNGIVVYEQPKIEEIRSFTIRNLSRLPAGVTKINAPLHFPVHVSPGLRKLTQKITQRIQKKIK